MAQTTFENPNPDLGGVSLGEARGLQYKEYLKILASLSEARRWLHTLYTSLNTGVFVAILAFLGVSADGESIIRLPAWMTLTLILSANGVGVALCLEQWLPRARRYRLLSRNLICKISQIEEKFPYRLFVSEYEELKKSLPSFWHRFRAAELRLPWLMAAVHVGIGALAVASFNLGVF